MTFLALASASNRWVAEDMDQAAPMWLLSITSPRNSGKWSIRRGRQRLIRLNMSNSPYSGLHHGSKCGKTPLFLHICYICMTHLVRKVRIQESPTGSQTLSCYLVNKVIWIHSELDSDWSGPMSCLGYSLVMLDGLNLTHDSWLNGQGHLIVNLATCFLNPSSSCIIKVAPSLFFATQVTNQCNHHAILVLYNLDPTDSGYK